MGPKKALILLAAIGLAGCTATTRDQQIEFLDRFSPDYVARQRMAQQCLAYGPKGSQGYAGCMLKVEQIAAQNRPVAEAPPPAMQQAPMPQHCMLVGSVWTCH